MINVSQKNVSMRNMTLCKMHVYNKMKWLPVHPLFFQNNKQQLTFYKLITKSSCAYKKNKRWNSLLMFCEYLPYHCAQIVIF